MILVVDDSPTVGSTVQWILHGQGHRIHVVRDGLAALSMLAQEVPDLILLDIQLPSIDGVKLCGMIRKYDHLKNVPIAMLSGLSDEDSIKRSYAAGANNYLVKPVKDDVLIKLVDELLA